MWVFGFDVVKGYSALLVRALENRSTLVKPETSNTFNSRGSWICVWLATLVFNIGVAAQALVGLHLLGRVD